MLQTLYSQWLVWVIIKSRQLWLLFDRSGNYENILNFITVSVIQSASVLIWESLQEVTLLHTHRLWPRHHSIAYSLIEIFFGPSVFGFYVKKRGILFNLVRNKKIQHLFKVLDSDFMCAPAVLVLMVLIFHISKAKISCLIDEGFMNGVSNIHWQRNVFT